LVPWVSLAWALVPDRTLFGSGETVRVLGGAEVEVDDGVAVAAVAELVAAGAPRRVAADVVAGLTGVARNALYRESL
jgi:hypothetical protein